jgi:hypothetical protein
MGELHAPHKGENGRRDAEADHVCQRIEFAAELAGGVGHAGDAAIESVEDEGEADGLGGNIEIGGSLAGVRREDQRALDGAQNAEIAKEDVGGGEERRQRVGGARRPFCLDAYV